MTLKCFYMSSMIWTITIKSSDTDVEVLACYFQTYIDAEIFVLSGTAKKSRVIDISSISRTLGHDICRALPGLHSLSGCDSVSAFSGKGKSKFFDVLIRNQNFTETLISIGNSFEISEELFRKVESFVCAVYGFPFNDINEVRFIMFCKSKQIQCHQLPPTKDAFKRHVQRANFQAAVWKRAFLPNYVLPSLDSHGWIIENNVLCIQWMDQQPASEALMLLISCGCKTNCSTRRCSCVSQGLACTDGCKCGEACQNSTQRASIDDTDDESDEETEQE